MTIVSEDHFLPIKKLDGELSAVKWQKQLTHSIVQMCYRSIFKLRLILSVGYEQCEILEEFWQKSLFYLTTPQYNHNQLNDGQINGKTTTKRRESLSSTQPSDCLPAALAQLALRHSGMRPSVQPIDRRDGSGCTGNDVACAYQTQYVLDNEYDWGLFYAVARARLG